MPLETTTQSPEQRAKEQAETVTGASSAQIERSILFGEMAKSLILDTFSRSNADGTYMNPSFLVRNKGMLIYDDMMRDDLIAPLADIQKTIILAFEFTIKPFDDSAYAKQRADFIYWCLTDGLMASFKDALNALLDGIFYGYSVSEINYRFLDSGPYRGLAGIKSIKSKPQWTIEFKPDQYGNLDGPDAMRQKPRMGESKPLSYPKFLHYAYNQKYENPYGSPLLDTIYRPWWCKDVVHKFYAMHLEKYGMPITKAAIPTTLAKDEKQELAKTLATFQSGTNFYHREDIKFEQWKPTPPSHYENAIQLFNTSISRGMKMPDLLGYTTMKFGSYALGREQAQLFYSMINVLREDMLDIVNYQLIPRLEEANFGMDGRYSQMVVTREKISDLIGIMDVASKAFLVGGFNPADASDLNYLRNKIGLRLVSEDKMTEYLKSWREARGINQNQLPQGALAALQAAGVGSGAIDPAGLGPGIGDSVVRDSGIPGTDPASTDLANAREIIAKTQTDLEQAGDPSGREIDKMFGDLRQTIYSGMEKMSDEQLSVAVSTWDDSDVDIQSRMFASQGRIDLSDRLHTAFEEAYRRGYTATQE